MKFYPSVLSWYGKYFLNVDQIGNLMALRIQIRPSSGQKNKGTFFDVKISGNSPCMNQLFKADFLSPFRTSENVNSKLSDYTCFCKRQKQSFRLIKNVGSWRFQIFQELKRWVECQNCGVANFLMTYVIKSRWVGNSSLPLLRLQAKTGKSLL